MLGVWEDRRIGGCPRWVYCDDRELMQVPEELRKCVCFIHARFGSKIKSGTAFFVGVPLDVQPPHEAVYVITARHCIMREDGTMADAIGLRLNTNAGPAEIINVPPPMWAWDTVADVAVLSLAPDREHFDYMYYWLRGSATKEFIAEQGVGPGEEVLISGLLQHHPGEKRILPIVRVGNIAAFPEEPLNLPTGRDHGVLVEVLSLGGLSGSQVFLHLPDWRRDEQGRLLMLNPDPEISPASGRPVRQSGANYLLGVIHGFYGTAPGDPDGIGDDAKEPLNTGITAVVPVDRIINIIDSPPFVKVRDEIKKDFENGTSTTPASGVTDSTEFENFETALRQVLSVSKSDLDEQLQQEKEARKRKD